MCQTLSHSFSMGSDITPQGANVGSWGRCEKILLFLCIGTDRHTIPKQSCWLSIVLKFHGKMGWSLMRGKEILKSLLVGLIMK